MSDPVADASVVSLAGTIGDRAAELAAVSETARDLNEAVTAATDATGRASAFDPDRGGWAWVRIADDGPGIPERERVVIEAGTEIIQLVYGRGLGLWLVKRPVQSHGGGLRIDLPGAEEPAGARGSTVTLLLPRAG